MRKSIYIKLLLSYAVYGIVVFIVICTFTQYSTLKYMQKREAQRLYRESALIAADYAAEYYKNSITLDDFQKHMEIVSDYLSADVWIVDNAGNILVDSSDSTVMNKAADADYEHIDNFDIADFGNTYSSIGDFYGYFDEDTLSVFSPITISYKNRGYVLIHKPIFTIVSGSDGFINISFYTVMIVFILAFLLLVIFTYSIYRPLRKITKAAQIYAKGDFTHKIDVNANNELGYLANTLNYMVTELDTLEEDQRKFVSNVSHDFRSPLTSIKGYVEAILDGTIPVEMQDKYLNIILFETERLNKLTKSLLDLNQFGHHGIRLDLADFDINNMIRTTIMTFEGKCREKSLSFDLVLTGQELFVNADMSKIQQVLYNLIDNATKFSNPDSVIKIETIIKNEKVFISVKDSGVGIPADSLNKIWERFYKTDPSRGKDKKGTGLGLAIVKEIIQAHKQNINVVSTEGAGTEFIFTLALSSRENA